MQTDLLWLSREPNTAPAWQWGEVRLVRPAPEPIAAALESLTDQSEFVLFWDSALGLPSLERIDAAIRVGGDVWHAGLAAGLGGLPTFMDYVNPSWRFTRNPDASLVATSWRLTLCACLARSKVISQLGGPLAAFDTLTGAGLELGHRWISNGALMRHVPFLLPEDTWPAQPEPLSLLDEFRLVRARFGMRWTMWALWRARHYGVPLADLLAAYRASNDLPAIPARKTVHAVELPALDRVNAPSVSVLIPTLDRYPYLFKVLDQLRHQTVAPLDIVVVDQTDLAARQWDWPKQFSDLPLHVIWRDAAGQCSSRNAGLAATRGETILFLDDDNEIEPDLIERHLAFLQQYNVDASVGVSEELGAGPLPADFSYVRDSNVFSTGNSLVHKQAFTDSGLFDLAYEHGSRADGDLGMRLYLTGKLLVLNPAAHVVHLRAPRGGLRQHGARVVTSASSESNLMLRHLMAPTEAYLLSRYFTPRQVNEALLIRSFSTLSSRQRGLGRLVRLLLMIALLPETHQRNRRSLAEGRAMLATHPTIPALARPLAQEIL